MTSQTLLRKNSVSVGQAVGVALGLALAAISLPSCKKRSFNTSTRASIDTNAPHFGLVLYAEGQDSYRTESVSCAKVAGLQAQPLMVSFCTGPSTGLLKALVADYAATVLNQARWALGFSRADATQFLANATTSITSDASELLQLEKDVAKIDAQQMLEFSDFSPKFEAKLLGIAEGCKGKGSSSLGVAPPVTVTNAWRVDRSGLLQNEEFAAMRGKDESERAWFVNQLCTWFVGTSAFASTAVQNAHEGGRVVLQPTDNRPLISSFWTLNKWANSGALQLLTLRSLQVKDKATGKQGVAMDNFVAVLNPKNEIEAIAVLGSKRFAEVMYIEYIATNPKNLSSDGPGDRAYGAITAVRHLMRFIAVDAAFARANDPTLENIVVKPVPMLRSLYERLGFKETAAPYICKQVADATTGQSFCNYLKKMRDAQLNLPPDIQQTRTFYDVPNGYVMHLPIDDAAKKLGLVIKADGSVLTGEEAEEFRQEQLNRDVRRGIM